LRNSDGDPDGNTDRIDDTDCNTDVNAYGNTDSSGTGLQRKL